ncbi:MAG: hypothetical protein ACWGMZ_04330 [Thermoguttaceae bacterium]
MLYRTFLVCTNIVLFCAVLASISLINAGICVADGTGNQVVRVEEDWEMTLGTPDAENDAPQVSCIISPVGNVCSVHGVFTLNHQSLPDYAAGGLQLQIWDDEEPLLGKNFPDESLMAQSDETVTWTQSMELKDGHLTFEIINGNSTTWGQFGGQGYLKAYVNSTLQDLNQYSPTVSVGNSGIGFASNRVQSLILKRVRLILSTGEVIEDNTARVVHQL